MRSRRLLLLLTVLLPTTSLPIGSASANGTSSNLVHGVCPDFTVEITAADPDSGGLQMATPGPQECLVEQTDPRAFPGQLPEWLPQIGSVTFSTRIVDPGFACGDTATDAAHGDDPTLWVETSSGTSQLHTNRIDVWRVSASPGGLETVIGFVMKTEDPNQHQTVVASGVLTKSPDDGCNLPQTWSGSIVFSDPDRSELGL